MKLVEFRMHQLEFFVSAFLEVHHFVSGAVHGSNQLVEFKVEGLGVTVLRVLNEEDHEEGNNGRRRVDD